MINKTARKIAFISTMPNSWWGGSEELWCEAARVALNEGHQVLISIYEWPRIHSKIDALIKKGAEIHKRPRYESSLSLMERIVRRIKERYILTNPFQRIIDFQPDFILISQAGSFDICVDKFLELTVLKINKPFALVSHTSLIDGICLSNAIRSKAKELFKQAKFIAFVADRTKILAEKAIAGQIRNTILLRNPVNISNKEIVPFPIDNKINFACIGSLSIDAKGYDILLEVFSKEKWLQRDWTLNIYGLGKDEDYLQELIKYYHLQDKVILQGYADNIRAVWKKNHLLIISSRLESAPLVLVEAMLCGRPSVSTDVGGVTEWLEDEVTGYLAEAATVKHIDRALEKAWRNKNCWSQLGLSAHEKALGLIDPNPGETLMNYLLK